MPGTQFIGQEGFQLNGFVHEFTRDEERVSKNKERGGYKVEIGRMPERNVTDDLLVTFTTIVKSFFVHYHHTLIMSFKYKKNKNYLNYFASKCNTMYCFYFYIL